MFPTAILQLAKAAFAVGVKHPENVLSRMICIRRKYLKRWQMPVGVAKDDGKTRRNDMEKKKDSVLLPIRCIVFLLVFIIGSQIVNKDLNEISNWWSIVATIVNFFTIGLLIGVAGKNNRTYWELINYRKGMTKAKQVIGITVLVVVVGMAGMYLAGFLCYGVIPYAAPMLIAPIPKGLALLNVFLLPITTALAEDGLYLGIGVNSIKNKYCAIIIPAFFFALQHSFIPVLVDTKYIIYRFLSFLPLTFILCWYYYRKRNPLPIMIGHAIIDFATVIQIIITSFVPGFYEICVSF